MSCYGSSFTPAGQPLVLPSAAVAQVKKSVRDEHNAIFEAVRAETKRFWVDLAKRTRSVEKYMEAAQAYECGEDRPRRPISFSAYGSPTAASRREDLVRDIAGDVVAAIGWEAKRGQGTLHQATVEDIKRHGFIEKATNRTTTFTVAREGLIAFDGRNVTWNSGYDNRQVERAHEDPVAIVFFAALKKIAWSRGTGGVICEHTENDTERARDYAGDGGSRITQAYGPIGEQARAGEMGVSLRKYREMKKPSPRRRY